MSEQKKRKCILDFIRVQTFKFTFLEFLLLFSEYLNAARQFPCSVQEFIIFMKWSPPRHAQATLHPPQKIVGC